MKDKTFFRANKLLKHYPLELNRTSNWTYGTKNDLQRGKLFDLISSMDTIIFTGSIAENYYKTLKSTLITTNMEIFSTNFEKDIKTINNHIKTVFKKDYKKLSIKVYRPFYQFWDERIEYHMNDESIIKIFGNNDICLPYNNLYISNDKIDKIQVGGFYKKKYFRRKFRYIMY